MITYIIFRAYLVISLAKLDIWKPNRLETLSSTLKQEYTYTQKVSCKLDEYQGSLSSRTSGQISGLSPRSFVIYSGTLLWLPENPMLPFLSCRLDNPTNIQTDRQTDRQTNSNITSPTFLAEVIIAYTRRFKIQKYLI